jgi:hypothetical protein
VAVRAVAAGRRGGDVDGRVEAGRLERERRLHAAARHPRDVDRRRLRTPARALHYIVSLPKWTRNAREAGVEEPTGARRELAREF